MKNIYLPGSSYISYDERAVIIEFENPHLVLSSSFLNGGLRQDLSYCFNYSEIYGKSDERCEMRAPTNEGHLCSIARELNLDPASATGLSTAAKMKYVQIKTEKHPDFSITAVVTAGIDVSGNRVGDPTYWHEREGVPVPHEAGTINVIVLSDVSLTGGAITRALSVTAEAKTAALQEVLAPSAFSSGLATGSGTDGFIIAGRLKGKIEITNAGTHCKFGEYLGRLVKQTVIDALVAENGFRSYARGDLLKRTVRFGIDRDSLLGTFKKVGSRYCGDPDLFSQGLALLINDEKIILMVTLYGHLIDLLDWELADASEVIIAAGQIISSLDRAVNKAPAFHKFSDAGRGQLKVELVNALTDALARQIAAIIDKGND